MKRSALALAAALALGRTPSICVADHAQDLPVVRGSWCVPAAGESLDATHYVGMTPGPYPEDRGIVPVLAEAIIEVVDIDPDYTTRYDFELVGRCVAGGKVVSQSSSTLREFSSEYTHYFPLRIFLILSCDHCRPGDYEIEWFVRHRESDNDGEWTVTQLNVSEFKIK